jgi:DNA-binding transcriptional MerR regulator
MRMNDDQRRFNLDELSSLTELTKRTIRFYIQTGLLSKPTGVGRGSHYNQRHLEDLLEIRKWQRAGLSLERIQRLLTDQDNAEPLPPLPRRQPGSVEVWSHLLVGEGVELIIEPSRAQLSPEQVRALASAVMSAYRGITTQEGEDT